ncbi:MAG: arylamine N-acetyltransferase [bacterium]
MIETVKGDEAAHIFLSHLKLGSALRGLPYLRGLARRFAELPYENISKILKAAEAPTPEEAMRFPCEVVTDHIQRGFGGTCFSLTFLFERMLTALGFDCYKVMADMRSGENVHCLVVVREGGAKHIVDPGYALYEVAALPGSAPGAAGTSRERVRCPHATVEIETREDGRYDLWTDDAAGRKWRYRFTDRPAADAEFERHWLESFGKPTLRNICLTRMTPRGHIYLRKDFFKFTSPEAVEKRRVKAGRERLVEEEFGIGAEWVEAAQRVLDLDAPRRGAQRRRGERG